MRRICRPPPLFDVVVVGADSVGHANVVVVVVVAPEIVVAVGLLLESMAETKIQSASQSPCS